ncbi:MAG: pyrimidine reductase [Ruminococcaceae bacterium]|nr:pyrimidine reductase [Oscillospiraceae bacterium]
MDLCGIINMNSAKENVMNRPYVICHMVVSVDGKVTGDYLAAPECVKATDLYYEINREYKADAFACGRITMEGSFTGGWYPDLSAFDAVEDEEDFVPDTLEGFYAVSFDPKGRLGWKENKIVDEDPGYGGAQIIEVLTSQADPKYLGYLRATDIPYIFAGETEIDVDRALLKLKEKFNINKLLLEGGSIINGSFQRAGAIDELSLVTAPIIAGEGKPLFDECGFCAYSETQVRIHDGAVWIRYKK